MSQVTLYRGVSSSEILSILQEGVPAFKSKYEEARAILGKYINPKILTDEFLEANKDYISWVRYRFRQFDENAGVFCLMKEQFSQEELQEKFTQIRVTLAKKGLAEEEIEKLVVSVHNEMKRQEKAPIHNAILYAQDAARERPEYERYVVSDLKGLKDNIAELEDNIKKAIAEGESPKIQKELEKRLACRKILLENLKPEYKDTKGNVHIPKEKGNYPIVLQIRGDIPLCGESEQEVRLKGDLKPEDIIGVAFAPDDPNEQPVFLSKEEFLKQFQQKKKTSTEKNRDPKEKRSSKLESFLMERADQKEAPQSNAGQNSFKRNPSRDGGRK